MSDAPTESFERTNLRALATLGHLGHCGWPLNSGVAP